MTKNTKKQNLLGANSKWDDSIYITAHILARDGLNNSEIADALGISEKCLTRWRQARPALDFALEQGRNPDGHKSGEAWSDYVYKKLPPDLQALWDDIERIQREPNSLRKIERIFEAKGKRARQHLFIHALASRNFDYSRACSMLGVSRQMVLRWTKTDPDFGRLLDEMQWHQKNFFENNLIKLVKQGDTHATIFVNKTKNRDRGYSEKIEVEHTGKVEVNVTHTVQVKDLGLPLEVRKLLLSKIREHRKTVEADQIKRLGVEQK